MNLQVNSYIFYYLLKLYEDRQKILVLLSLLVSASFMAYSQTEHIIDISDTTLTKKEVRKSDKANERKRLKPHVFISAMATYAKLHSQVSFEHSSKLLRAQIDFEDHLGLESTQ